MKSIKSVAIVLLCIFSSCSSLKVTTDYDTEIDFSKYKTFAFYKKGIDKADVSDLDKKRILRAIEEDLTRKGFLKSEKPDFVISILTKSKERVNVTDTGWGLGWGWGWGMNPWMFGNMNRIDVNQYTEGTLFIDFIDKESNNLVWQGIGSGILQMKNAEKKNEKIREFVKQILEKYPPTKE